MEFPLDRRSLYIECAQVFKTISKHFTVLQIYSEMG